ncbi:MAG: phytanoyl-CoA dioxygenase family protein [Terrimonas sp.]|nr:phytanoyl-CoA dioxygenase family protein [Terrimonas sp.]OJY92798.1 MAG: phytanoyl-CoA dioxygenase [Sphingobacteriales bacterium 40-81]
MNTYRPELNENGFTTIADIYSMQEVQQIISIIDEADKTKDTFRKSNDIFAIRQFLKEIPDAGELIFNHKLKRVITGLFGSKYFVVKSIYFDKPESSNWYVSYHQDLTISVDHKVAYKGFTRWTTKYNQFAVEPPVEYLENIFTIRIHLDDTNVNNGALKVVPGSHARGIYRPETIDWRKASEKVCEVPAGGIMIMKPLLLHSSGRTTNFKRRRVIHIEFADKALPQGMQWAELLMIRS